MTDDKTLAIRCRDGDNAAREELYRRYSPRLLSLCLRYCQDRPQAEDTMHDAFVRILESIGKYRYTGEGSLTAGWPGSRSTYASIPCASAGG